MTDTETTRFYIPTICTAYEQGIGRALNDPAPAPPDNPYPDGWAEHEAWERGAAMGRRMRTQRQGEEAQDNG